jgi:magnesium chelatase family protein
MSTKLVKQLCILTPESQKFLAKAIDTFHLSARSYYRVIKIARTIADLSNENDILLPHIAEALQFRPKDIGGEPA